MRQGLHHNGEYVIVKDHKIHIYRTEQEKASKEISRVPDLSSSPLERKTKRKKQRKDKRKIYPYFFFLIILFVIK